MPKLITVSKLYVATQFDTQNAMFMSTFCATLGLQNLAYVATNHLGQSADPTLKNKCFWIILGSKDAAWEPKQLSIQKSG